MPVDIVSLDEGATFSGGAPGVVISDDFDIPAGTHVELELHLQTNTGGRVVLGCDDIGTGGAGNIINAAVVGLDYSSDFTQGVNPATDCRVTIVPDAGQTMTTDATDAGAVIDLEGTPPPEPTDPGYEAPLPAKAILEIYVHDESASRWGTATWATGPATGTEGIWSAAGWTDITPEGVLVHVRWGAQRPERGILADQDAASWKVDSYDPDRRLDPGNDSSPFYPQLVPGLPIRISHDGFVIRTGLCDVIGYSFHAPEYQGTILATDTIAPLNQAMVPDASVLGDTLFDRARDALAAADIAIGGLSIMPSLYGIRYGSPPVSYLNGPDLSAQQPGEVSVWSHIREAAREVLHIVSIDRHGTLSFRPWGMPIPGPVELTAPILMDMLSIISEDGVYSVVRVKDEPGTGEIEREADPFPRYGRRIYERQLTTIDPDAFADAVLADRAWPGVQWRPGTLRPRTAAEVTMLAGIRTMERIDLSIPAVTVSGIVLGGELWAQHRANAEGAEWRFRFSVMTEGSSVLGETILVADVTGDILLDDETGTDYLTPDE
jgi:hypothetical protein